MQDDDLVYEIHAVVRVTQKRTEDEQPLPPARHKPRPFLTADEVRQMYANSQATHRQLLEHLAQTPDEWVWFTPIARALGLEPAQARGSIGTLVKRANHDYGGRMPWESKWDRDAHQARYRMPAEIAEVVNQLG
jgi:hypothetical protein